MQAIDYPPVQQALDRLKTLSADAETRHQAMARERALFEEATAMNAAMARGMELGEAKGEIKGEIKGEAKALTRMLAKRFGPLSIETSQRLQSATPEQLERSRTQWQFCDWERLAATGMPPPALAGARMGIATYTVEPPQS